MALVDALARHTDEPGRLTRLYLSPAHRATAEATLAMMREVRYDSAFMFKYSRRDHTRAAKWDETADDDEKARRLQAVIALQEEIATEINAGWIGREVEVLVEGPARRPLGWVAGKTAHFKTIVLPAGDARPGDLVRVRVADATGYTLIAAA